MLSELKFALFVAAALVVIYVIAAIEPWLRDRQWRKREADYQKRQQLKVREREIRIAMEEVEKFLEFADEDSINVSVNGSVNVSVKSETLETKGSL